MRKYARFVTFAKLTAIFYVFIVLMLSGVAKAAHADVPAVLFCGHDICIYCGESHSAYEYTMHWLVSSSNFSCRDCGQHHQWGTLTTQGTYIENRVWGGPLIIGHASGQGYDQYNGYFGVTPYIIDDNIDDNDNDNGDDTPEAVTMLLYSDQQGTQPIDTFTNCFGTLTFSTNRAYKYFDDSDCSSFFMRLEAKRNSETVIMFNLTLNLPEGFSFSEWEIVRSKQVTFTAGTTGSSETMVEIFPQYVPMTGSEQNVTFTVTGELEESLTIPMVRSIDEGKIYCRPTDKVNSSAALITMKVSMDPVNDLVARSVSSYSANLSKIECALTQAIYGDSNEDDTQIKRSLLNLGFSQIKYFPSSGNHGVACVIAQKKVICNGEVRNALMLVVRGTLGTEWVGNFYVNTIMENLGSAGGEVVSYHSDFWAAAKETEQNINIYMEYAEADNKTIPTAFTRAHVCGHSRGAAVANIVCKDINNGVISFRDMTSYTFATPNSMRNGAQVGNVFNIIDATDLVAFVPQGYEKYGTTYVVGMNASEYPSNVQQLLNQYARREVSRPNNDLLINIACYLGQTGNIILSDPNIAAILGRKLSIPPDYETGIAKAHGAENYLAWVNADLGTTASYNTAIGEFSNAITQGNNRLRLNLVKINAATRPSFNTFFLLAKVLFQNNFYFLYTSCPVDVEVVNNGTVITAFSNHTLVTDSNDIIAWTEEESDYLIIPKETSYTLRIIGTGDGVMNVGSLLTNDAYDALGTAQYMDVPVFKGYTYEMLMDKNTNVSAWILTGENGETYDANEQPLLLPEHLVEISSEAFADTALNCTIICANGLLTIGERAFANSGIKCIQLPDSVTSIAEDAFVDNARVVIYCNEGSYAQQWAVEHGFAWIDKN